ncbi:MAG TPA: two-component regulator propeller domain-containing protein, partial [Bryobacteraceae bacterium]
MGPRIKFAAIWLVLLAPLLTAQRYNFKRYDQNAGLANQNVQTLLQDRTGLLWIGSENGLYRYDGRRFRTFNKDDGLPASGIEAVHETPDGTLWVATLSGLARRKGERFETVDLSPGKAAVALASDRAGRLYVGTWSGLLIAEPASGTSARPVFSVRTIPGKASQVVRSIAVSESGVVWYGCGVQLCRLEGGRVLSEAGWGVPDDLWQAVLIDSRGSVWARSRTRLIELPKGQSRFVPRDQDLPPAATQGTLLATRDGQLWVPTLRGLAQATPSGWDIVGKARGLPISSVQCALEDREGSIWIGLNGGGLVRWLGFPLWETWTEAEGLSSDSIWQIRRDRDGVLWSASDTGLSRFDPDTHRWSDPKIPGLPVAQTTAIQQAPDGALWLGQVGGAVRIDLHRGTAVAYGKDAGLPYPWISDLMVDPQNTVWASTPKGLFRGVPVGGEIRFQRQKLPIERGGTDYLTEILMDRRGRIWVGGLTGLFRLEAGQWTRLTTADGLLHDHVSHLGLGSEGSLWIGYFESLGVSQLASNDGRLTWRHFSQKDGLKSGKAMFVKGDVRGRIWVGTDRGADVFEAQSWRHFDHTDGLVWDDCNGKAFWADSDGSIWIGTSRGISHLRIPAAGLPQRPLVAPVRLTSAMFGDRSVGSGEPVSVPWSQRSAEFGFTAMTFLNEDTVLFRYRIAGLEERWTETQSGEAHMPSLPAGSYTFEVQANAGPGAWPPARASQRFTIRPAWWRTWWFEMGLVAIACLLAHQ